jgi:hypothetical protein
MRIRRKTRDCLNCGLSLNEIYNYCPRCGQENNNRIVSFGELVRDFFVNYFSFDTNFYRSIRPFLFKPGKLTTLFIEGKRASFVNPLRLYIIVSVVFFFLSTLWIKESMQASGDNTKKEMTLGFADAVADDEQDSTELAEFYRPPAEATAKAGQDSITSQDSGISDFNDVLTNENLSDEEALDSLENMGGFKMDLNNGFNRLAFTQLRKVVRQDMDIFLAYVMQNMPVMMFLLLPVYALLLKLLYVRRNVLYVKHLVHGVHLHAFTFFLLTLLLLFSVIFDPLPGIYKWVQIIIFSLLMVYIYASMRRVYRQGWFKTLLKFGLLGFFYFFILVFFGISEAFISFLIF